MSIEIDKLHSELAAARFERDEWLARLREAEAAANAPIPMQCGARHVDVGRFETHPHHTHACQGCGHVWRPAIRPTVGVQFLPGFRDQDQKP